MNEREENLQIKTGKKKQQKQVIKALLLHVVVFEKQKTRFSQLFVQSVFFIKLTHIVDKKKESMKLEIFEI